jgi:5-oxoprolinase (ATP-hydrolysing)
MAASSGTMNNFTFGNHQYQYYETVSGGTGAGPTFVGCDAVQAHMTNSRLTDPEVLELRYPVIVVKHAIRRGSGGKGKFRGLNTRMDHVQRYPTRTRWKSIRVMYLP